jgi:hypothetical protein
VNQVPHELLHYYFDVTGAGAGEEGTPLPDDIALSLPSQAKALPQTDTPNAKRTATKELFIANLLYHRLNTIRQSMAV